VADTNAHRIRVVDLKTKAVRTLALKDVTPPKPAVADDRPSFPNPTRTILPERTVPGDGELTLQVELRLPAGSKLNPDAPMTYVVETLPGTKTAWSATQVLPEVRPTFTVSVPAGKVAEASGLRLSLQYYECSEGSRAICRVKSHIWEIPFRPGAAARERVMSLTNGPALARDEKK